MALMQGDHRKALEWKQVPASLMNDARKCNPWMTWRRMQLCNSSWKCIFCDKREKTLIFQRPLKHFDFYSLVIFEGWGRVMVNAVLVIWKIHKNTFFWLEFQWMNDTQARKNFSFRVYRKTRNYIIWRLSRQVEEFYLILVRFTDLSTYRKECKLNVTFSHPSTSNRQIAM